MRSDARGAESPVWWLALSLLGGLLQALAFCAAPGTSPGASLGTVPGAALAAPLADGALSAPTVALAGAARVAWSGWHISGASWLPGLLQVLGQALLAWVLLGLSRPDPADRGGAGRRLAGDGRRAALAAWLYAAVWLAGSVWWLYISMHRYGGLPAWLAALAVLALCGALALYWAAAGWACTRWRSGRPLVDAVLFAALCLMAELARGQWFTGFPWATAGYAHVDGPLADWAPWLGVYGMGALAAFIAACLAQIVAMVRRGWRGNAALAAREHEPGVPWVSSPALNRLRREPWICAGVALACLVVPSLLPREFTQSTGSLSVTLLQGNVPQDEKFDPALLPTAMNWHISALRQARTDLVLGAETALPLLPIQMPDGVWDGLTRQFSSRANATLFGVPLGDFDNGFTNSAMGFAPGQPPYRYDKHHLVPFGEFIPPGFHWFVRMMNIPLGDFNRGPLVALSMRVGAQRVAPNICYEDVFGEELAARFTQPDQAPTLLANLSNIGWFGDTIAVTQHLQMSRLRTMELQRPMLRATNTGATVAIDHQGQVLAALRPYTQGVIETEVEGRSGLTPFAWWAGNLGLWPLWLVAMGCVVWRARHR